MDHTSTQKTTKEAFVSAPYIQGLSEEFGGIFKDTKVQIISKGCNTLKNLLMHQDVVHQWTCLEYNCNSSYMENQADT